MLGIKKKWYFPTFFNTFREKNGRKQKPLNHQESTIWPVWWLTTQFCPQILKNVSITSIPPEPLISGVVCQGPIDCSTSLTKSRNLLSWYQECGRRSVEQKTQTTKVKQSLEQEKSKVNGAKMKMLTHNTSRSRKFHTFSEPAQWRESKDVIFKPS